MPENRKTDAAGLPDDTMIDERCPTCNSDDRAVRNFGTIGVGGLPHGVPCPDSFHAKPTPETCHGERYVEVGEQALMAFCPTCNPDGRYGAFGGTDTPTPSWEEALERLERFYADEVPRLKAFAEKFHQEVGAQGIHLRAVAHQQDLATLRASLDRATAIEDALKAALATTEPEKP